MWLTLATVPAAQGLPVSASDVVREVTRSGFTLIPVSYPKFYKEGHQSVDCLHIACGMGTSNIDCHSRPGHGWLKGPGLSWPDHYHLWQEGVGRHHGIRVTCLLHPLYEWHILGPEGILGTRLSSSLLIVKVRGQPYLPHQTPPLNCICRGIPLTCSIWVLLICVVPIMEWDL